MRLNHGAVIILTHMNNSLKLLFFPFLLLTFITSTQAQVYVEEVDINALDINYVQIVGFNKAIFQQKVIITVDYGQKTKIFESQLIKDANGQQKIFNSMIDALNFMEANGWEYVNNTEYSVGNSRVSHFLLKRR